MEGISLGAGEMDPRVLLAVTLIGLGVSTAQKLKELWQQSGVDEETLDKILAEVERRIQRRA
jgi:hypothetical protein